MIKFIPDVRDKLSLTKILIEELSPDDRISIGEARILWWHNTRRNGGMRLTSQGYHTFRVLLNLTYYEFNIDDPIQFNQKIMLDLDRKLQTPYYILSVKGIPKKIVFFGSREAMVTNLYGNLKKFLDNYQP